MLGMATNTKYSYPQKYFLIPEACRYFGLKERTLKSWRETGIDVPGLLKVKGSNYYVIEPIEFHAWLIEAKLEPATKLNKLHNRRPIPKGGKSRNGVSGGNASPFPPDNTPKPKPNIPGLTL